LVGYALEVLPSCEKEIKKLCKKNRELGEALRKKMEQVLGNPYHFKPLKKPLQNRRRVHVFHSFVLTYKIDEAKKSVVLVAFKHHDDAY